MRRLLASAPDAAFGASLVLPGPVGEENTYRTEARGTVGCVAATPEGLRHQVRTALATGNRAVVPQGGRAALPAGPADLVEEGAIAAGTVDAVLFEGTDEDLLALAAMLAEQAGAIVPVLRAGADGRYAKEPLVRERSLSVNTTAAGGNAHLMTIG